MQADWFFELFVSYNNTYVAMVAITYALGIVALILAIWKKSYSDKVISTILTVLWLWVGVVFGFIVYGPTTSAIEGTLLPGMSLALGGLWTIQGFIVLYFGVIKNEVSYDWKPDIWHLLGAGLILYALAIYPLVGFLAGHSYPGHPVFGTAPCPVTIFTIGILLWSVKKPHMPMLTIPIIWSFMGGIGGVLFLGVYADAVLFIAGIIGLCSILRWTEPSIDAA